MWGKIIIPVYRLWLNGLYGLYGPRCPLSSKRPINLISLSLAQAVSSQKPPMLGFGVSYIRDLMVFARKSVRYIETSCIFKDMAPGILLEVITKVDVPGCVPLCFGQYLLRCASLPLQQSHGTCMWHRTGSPAGALAWHNVGQMSGRWYQCQVSVGPARWLRHYWCQGNVAPAKWLGPHTDELVQEICNSSALAVELHLSCTEPSIQHWLERGMTIPTSGQRWPNQARYLGELTECMQAW